MKKNMPTSIIRFLINWYSIQQLTIPWNEVVSRPFSTLSSVRQSGVLSPLLFSLYLDDLLADHDLQVLELVATTWGCLWVA